MHRTHYPKVGQVCLSDLTFYPRKNCLVGQNPLGKCVLCIHFPVDRFSYDNRSEKCQTIASFTQTNSDTLVE